MLFAEQDAPVLKAWIVSRLETAASSDNDVDADVLADYVLALLKHGDDAAGARKNCETELYDFLKDDAVPFVRDVFRALSTKSYLPPARRPPPAPKPNSQHPPASSEQALSSGARKRAYDDSSLFANGAGDAGDAGAADGARDAWSNGQGAAKQTRRNGTFRGGDRGGAGRGAPSFAPPGGHGGPPFAGAALEGQLPPLPPLSVEEILHMQQQMGLPLPPFASFGATGRPASKADRAGRASARRPRPCRYFERKGVCTKPGCPFDHSGAPPATDYGLPLPPSMLAPEALLQFQQQSSSLFPFFASPAAAGLPAPYFQPPPYGDLAPPAATTAAAKRRRPPRKEKAPFSADGPVYDETQSTIVVEGIPDEFLSEAAVASFFSQFGPVVSVAVRPARKLALVQFESWAAANAAYRSPKAVFDNRFVKVFWHRAADGDGTVDRAGSGGGRPSSGPGAARRRATAVGEDGGASDGDGDNEQANGGSNDGPGEPEFDMDEFLRRQEEAQRLHEEKTRKKKALEQRQQELEQRQRELLSRSREERIKLVSKMALAAKRARPGPTGSGGSGSGSGSSSGSASSGTPASAGNGGGNADVPTPTELFRAQLAALEDEARMLGLDPDSIGGGGDGQAPAAAGAGGGAAARQPPAAPYGSAPASWAARGGSSGSSWGRGRGGGRGGLSYRGRGGSFASRGGISGANASVYAAYSLDNRPRRVAVAGVDLTAPDKDEALRQYLLGVGDFTAIEKSAGATTITFADRRTAEAFYFGLPPAAGPRPGGEPKAPSAGSSRRAAIPGIAEPVELRWVANGHADTGAFAGTGAGAVAGQPRPSAALSAEAAGQPTGRALAGDADGALIVEVDEDGGEDEAQEEEEEQQEEEQQQQRQRQQNGHKQSQSESQNMDFDVAGDGDWEIE